MADIKEKKVTVLVNREYEEQDSVVVGINGTLYQIQTDVEVEVPWFVAENLKNCKLAKEEMQKRARAGGKKK